MHSIITSAAVLFALASPARDPTAPRIVQISTRVQVCTDSTSPKGSTPNARDLAVHWEPAVPHAGSLFRVHITSVSGASSLTGAFANEPVHFRASGKGATAWGAVPIDSTNGATLEVRCGSGSTTRIRIPTVAGDYSLEQLRVAPKFASQPDSALAARLRDEADHASAVSRGAHETPRMWSTPFMAPRTSRITSGFGGGRMFNGTVASRHLGTDYAGRVGDPVRAANRGVVRLVSAFYLGGNVIYLDHGEGIVTAYLHLSRQLVQVGDTVARGAIIGRVGATGRVTGPHLHLIARFGSVTIDAASLIAMRDSL
jgi:murein DD-endopeptidase MepM/ murein hydrolase activator NlpD